MRILITGADQRLGAIAGAHFGKDRDVLLTGQGSENPVSSSLEYRSADLRDPEAVPSLVEGVDAVLHLGNFDPPALTSGNAEQDRLEISARGTYVLLDAARTAGVERVVLASTLDLVSDYPEDYLVDEFWQPRPEAHADSLAPYLSEIVCREYCREGGIRCVCLRFGPIDKPDGTKATDAVEAMEKALVMSMKDPGYRWQLVHISSSPRRPSVSAKRVLGFELEGEA
jgi:uronate dehydrogenase